ncbi:unnamed protein product [Linum trigynum]|uniref:Bromo domain-containing protein n=1 Tax=Linum trigynum TaxID=586398 RepID=A0AAV2ECP9_9ROSI
MGKAAATAETMTKKRKKKGRPSLLDLQKRAIKQELQQQQLQQKNHQNPPPKNRNQNPIRQNPNSRRSARRNPHSGGEDDDGDGDGDDDDDERKEKKHKLLLGLNSQKQQQQSNTLFRSNSSASNSYGSGSDNPEAGALAIVKYRQIGGVRPGSDETGEKFWKATDTLHGLSGEEPGPTTTPLPDKKLLVFILDRLQKKDTYGVFSDPVDTEELPDYLDIIDHPMDFSTVRTKLDGGEYSNLEQFEGDIFLICSNAMQYNSSDTVYHRQARSIQELAKKDFENLRQDSDDGEPEEPKMEKVVRRGRPPGKSKKSLEKPPLDRLAIEFSSDATLATGGDNSIGLNGYNLRKTTLFKQPSDAVLRITNGPHNGETHAWQSEWENEFPASVVKAVMKHSKRTDIVDENRRDTYNPPSASAHKPSVLNSLDGELKQLVAVGLSAEFGYARSLAQYAAGLGPTAWSVASKKIQHVLPMGVEFGPGWVGENDVVQSGRVLSNDTASGDPSNSHRPPSTSTNTTPTTNLHQMSNREDIAARSGAGPTTSFDNGITPTIKSMALPPVQQQILGGGSSYNCSTSQVGVLPTTPYRPFGVVQSSSTSFSQMQQGHAFDPNKGKQETFGSGKDLSSAPGSIRPTTTTGFAGSTAGPQGLPPAPSYHNQQELLQFSTDLNVGFLSPGSPSSSGVVPIRSPQQPDLALQL